jgi:predicted RNA-binding Zn-ribbon protein involved in translation (DUF1610 family)
MENSASSSCKVMIQDERVIVVTPQCGLAQIYARVSAAEFVQGQPKYCRRTLGMLLST